jgi:hypothetical protein
LKIPAAHWLWLFVVTYIIHVAEEYWGGEGYSAHLLRSQGVYMSPTRFLVVQAIGIALMSAGILIAKRLKFPNAMAVILGAAVLGNGFTHTLNALRAQSYESGLISAIVIWIPLGLFSIIYFRRRILNQTRFWTAVAIGIGINVAIAIITMSGGKL